MQLLAPGILKEVREEAFKVKGGCGLGIEVVDCKVPPSDKTQLSLSLSPPLHHSLSLSLAVSLTQNMSL